jgi:hypothetical protein
MTHFHEEHVLQVQQFMDRDPAGPKNIDALNKVLKILADECPEKSIYSQMILQLQDATYGIRTCKGQPGITRKIVKTIFEDFSRCVMPMVVKSQQQRQRVLSGRFIATDNTYAPAASLIAVHEGQTARYSASVTTITGEGGYVHAMHLAPNDKQSVPLAVMCGLYGAPLPEYLSADEGAEYLQIVRDEVASSGCMGHIPVVIATDKAIADSNLWARIGKEVLDSFESRGQEILSQLGTVFRLLYVTSCISKAALQGLQHR